jgi:hypothetical protein
MPSSALLVAAALLVSSSGQAPTDATVIERVLAVVDRRPVLLSEVRLLQVARGVGEKQALELLVDELLMYGEARRFPQSRPSPEQEQSAFASLARLRGQGPTDAELRRLAHREATILRYLGLRLRPLVRVSDEAVRAAFDREEAGRQNARSFAEAAAEIRERLTREQLDLRVEEWARQLRETADLHYLAESSVPGP